MIFKHHRESDEAQRAGHISRALRFKPKQFL
jgi:hypothetical protein